MHRSTVCFAGQHPCAGTKRLAVEHGLESIVANTLQKDALAKSRINTNSAGNQRPYRTAAWKKHSILD